jgi:hypothetical protein
MPFSVIPAKAGIQLIHDVLDPGFRRGDGQRDFLRTHLPWFDTTGRVIIIHAKFRPLKIQIAEFLRRTDAV